MNRIAKFLALAFCLSLSLAAPAMAGPWEEAVAAYKAENYAKAFNLFRSLAEQGNASAQSNLGAMYYNGQGVPQDYKEAVKWYGLAAKQGGADAQYNLGVMYDKGQGVPQDYKQAVKWYRLAAEHGDAGAQYNLGLMYYKGQGVPQDYVQAHKWLNLAAANSDPDASKIRDTLAELMTPQQIAEAQKLAREWKPKPPNP